MFKRRLSSAHAAPTQESSTKHKADPDKVRRNVVKVRTAQYLQRAERLVARLTKRDIRLHDSTYWAPSATVDSLVSPPSYLKNYRVFGVSGKVILAVDNSTKETVAIKRLRKNNDDPGGNAILPVGIPHMVPLIRYHETEFAIYLILKYISGGKLLHHISNYISQSKSEEEELFSAMNPEYNFIYAGCRLISEEAPDLPASKSIANLENYLNPSSKIHGISNHIHSIRHRDICERKLDGYSQKSATEPVFIDESSDTLSLISEDFDNSGMSSIDNSCIEIIDGELQMPRCKNSNFTNISNGDLPRKVLVRDETCSLNGLDLHSNMDSSVHRARSSLSGSCMTLSEGVNARENSANAFSLNFDELIRNSKRLLNDVTETLEKSKTQVLNLPSDVITTSNNHPNCDTQSSISSCEKSPSDKAQSSKLTPSPSLSLDGNCQQPIKTSIVNSDISPHKLKDKMTDLPHNPDSRDIMLGESLKNLSLGSEKQSPMSLSKLLERYRSHANLGSLQLPENLVKVWISQVISAIHAVHMLGIIWGDFNLSNVLLDDGGSILVTYESHWPCITLRRKFPQGEDGGYIAPELSSPLSQLGFSSDWWSIGALLYHLLTGNCVSDAHSAGVLSHTELLLPDSLSREARSLVLELLRFDPKERLGGGSLGVQEIKDHPFFMGVQWES